MLNTLFVIALVIAAVGVCVKRYAAWREKSPFLFGAMMVFLIYASLLFGQTIEWAKNGWGNATIQRLIFIDAFGPDKQVWGGVHIMFLFVVCVFCAATIWGARRVMSWRFVNNGAIGSFFSGIAPFAMPALMLFFFATTGAHLRAANIDVAPFSEAAADVTGQAVVQMSGATGDIAYSIAAASEKEPNIPQTALDNIKDAEEKDAEQAEIQKRQKADDDRAAKKNKR